MSSYDLDGEQRRNVRGILTHTAVCVVLTLCFAVIWAISVGPYTNLYNERSAKIEKAHAYLNSTLCSDPVTRVRAEGLNRCEEQQLIASQWVTIGAFYDLMSWLAVCRNDVCMIAGVNVSSTLWWVAVIALAVALCMWCFSIVGMATSVYARNTAYYQLPMTQPHFAAGPGGHPFFPYGHAPHAYPPVAAPIASSGKAPIKLD